MADRRKETLLQNYIHGTLVWVYLEFDVSLGW